MSFVGNFMLYFLVAVIGLAGIAVLVIGLAKNDKRFWISGSIVTILSIFFIMFSIINGIRKVKRAVTTSIQNSSHYSYNYNQPAITENIEQKKIEGDLILENNSKEKISMNLPIDYDENILKIYHFEIIPTQKSIELVLKIEFFDNFDGKIMVDLYDSNQYILGTLEENCKYKAQLISLKLKAKDPININKIQSLDLKINKF